MNKQFRLATPKDADQIFALILQAQAYFKNNGIDQWQNGYPNEQSVQNDIAANACYIVEHDGAIVASAALYFTEEANYNNIYEGAWHTACPYAAIHRVAVADSLKGSGVSAFLYAGLEAVCREKKIGSVRGDTHRDNVAMQKFMLKMGFAYCGIIYLDDGAERLAYDKSLSA